MLSGPAGTDAEGLPDCQRNSINRRVCYEGQSRPTQPDFLLLVTRKIKGEQTKNRPLNHVFTPSLWEAAGLATWDI